ncbi:MAG: DNA polymerase III subunit delta [Kyrpidia sp.]|nr:DNA polymerase III subunit delta [Kyrpidia sp.]
MYWDRWVEEIRGGRLAPIYVLDGPETYVARLIVEELLKACPIAVPEMNVARFDLLETPVQQVVLEARTVPFFSERRLIIASGGEALGGRAKVGHDLAAWEDYVDQPSAESVVVVLVGDQKVDERKKWVRGVKAKGRWWTCAALRESELAAWIRREAEARGKRIESDAVRRLILLSGGHLELLAGELDKLSLYVPGESIRTEDVDQVVVPFPEQDVFRWVDDVVRLKTDRALTGLDRLLRQKESPVKLLMLLARQFRLIYHAVGQSRRGHAGTDIAAQLGIRPFAFKIALEQGRLYSLHQISRVLQWLADLDADIKTGRRTDRDALADFVAALPIRLKGGTSSGAKAADFGTGSAAGDSLGPGSSDKDKPSPK